MFEQTSRHQSLSDVVGTRLIANIFRILLAQKRMNSGEYRLAECTNHGVWTWKRMKVFWLFLKTFRLVTAVNR